MRSSRAIASSSRPYEIRASISAEPAKAIDDPFALDSFDRATPPPAVLSSAPPIIPVDPLTSSSGEVDPLRRSASMPRLNRIRGRRRPPISRVVRCCQNTVSRRRFRSPRRRDPRDQFRLITIRWGPIRIHHLPSRAPAKPSVRVTSAQRTIASGRSFPWAGRGQSSHRRGSRQSASPDVAATLSRRRRHR